MAPAQPLIAPGDRTAAALVVVLALAFHIASALLEARSVGLPLSSLGVFGDGHLYLEIAKSFPLPFAAEGRDYLGQAPGYPALIYLLRVLVPDDLANWGLLALLAAWIPAALAAGAFYRVCRQAGLRPLAPALAFVVCNPTWAWLACNPNSEPLAMCLAILAFHAYQRDRLGWFAAWLSLAVLSRFPALMLVAAYAFDTLWLRHRRDARTWLLIALPALVFGAWNLYLLLRIPDFPGVFAAHSIFWQTRPTWPFDALVQMAPALRWPTDPQIGLTYLTLFALLAALPLGLRRSERARWVLPLWIAVLLLFHVSLSGEPAAWAFPRLVVLAWPAALLVLWRAAAGRVPAALGALPCAAAAALSLWLALPPQTGQVIRLQMAIQSYLQDTLRRLDSDEPHWVDFREFRKQRRRALPAERPTPDRSDRPVSGSHPAESRS